MENRYKKNKILKDLDLFIQNTIDKYFYVKPWKKLYDRTGKLHRDIISDKSTIPDLIIYNKIFNKSDCFFESNNSSYIKFPRMRFILRPKYKKEYNPSSTYGQADDVCFIHKQKNSDDKNTFIDLSLNNKIKEENFENNAKQNLENFLDQNNILYEQNKTKEKKPDLNEGAISNNEDDEDEPEWANDNVEDYNNIKIEFKTIPKSLEEKLVEELELSPKVNNDNDKNLEQIKDMNTLNFFKSNDSNIENNDNIYQEIKDFMNIDSNENNIFKEEKNINNKNDISNDNYSNNNLNDNFKPHFNIFDTENKFNEFFIKFQESNDTNKEEKYNNNINNNNTLKICDFPKINENNIILNELNQNKESKDNLIKNAIIQELQQKEKQKYLQMIQIQKLQNQIENQNINLQNSPSYFLNNSSFMNKQLFKNNSNSFGYSNNLNYPNNNNIMGILNNNYNPYNNANRFCNLNHSGYIYNYINNYKDMYVNKINGNLYRNNIYQLYKNNINYNKEMFKPKDIESEIHFNNINQFNNNKNILTQNILKNVQYDRNNPNFNNDNDNSVNNNISYVNSISNLLNDIDKNNVNINEQNNYKKGLNDAENNNKLMNIADYLNNPTLFIIKNTDRKNWLVLNTNNSIIRNFNSKELLDFLEEKAKNNMPLDEFTINDFDIDVVFPAKEIYEILKKFYYQQK